MERRDAPAELVELVGSCLLEARERPTAHEFCSILQKVPGFKVRTDRVGEVVKQVLGRGPRSRDTLYHLETVDLESSSDPHPPSMLTASVAKREDADSSDEVDEDKRTIALPAMREEERVEEPVTVKKLASLPSVASAGGADAEAQGRTEVLPVLHDDVPAPRVWKTARIKEEDLPGVPIPRNTSEHELGVRAEVTDVELVSNRTSPLLPSLEGRSLLLRRALLLGAGVMLTFVAAGLVAWLVLGGA